VLKFQKYLPEFGFRASVLAGRLTGCHADDAQRGVYRAGEPALVYRPLLRALLSAGRSRGPSDGQARISEGSVLRPVRDLLLEWVVIPDLQVAWLPWAVRRGLQVLRRARADAIVSSSGPVTNHLVGALLSAATKIPLVADFRDGWLFEPLAAFLRENRLRRRLDGRLEAWVVSRAARVVTVSEPLTEDFRRRYGLAERAVTIPNGYDPDEWAEVVPAPRGGDRLRLVHCGAFARSRATLDPKPFLAGLASLPREVRARLEVLLVGGLSDAEARAVSELDLGDAVRILPPVTRRESLGYQLSADVLLLVAGHERSVATSKLYEYLYARHPVLAVGHPEVAACRIVRETGAGVVAPPEREAVRAVLLNLFDLWSRGGLDRYGRGDIRPYDRRQLAGRLAGVLEAVAGPAGVQLAQHRGNDRASAGR